MTQPPVLPIACPNESVWTFYSMLRQGMWRQEGGRKAAELKFILEEIRKIVSTSVHLIVCPPIFSQHLNQYYWLILNSNKLSEIP